VKALGALVMVLCLGLLTAGPVLFGGAAAIFFERSRREYREREELEDMLEEIERRFEGLVGAEADDDQHPVLERLRSEYAEYRFSVNDISSGFNLNFLPETDLTDESLEDFLFSGGASRFLAFREAEGFMETVDAWEPFLNDAARASVVCYGWMHRGHAGSGPHAMVAAALGGTEEELYPVVNDMALINVNTADPAVFRPLLSRGIWKIKDAEKKADALMNRLSEGPVTEGELKGILSLPAEHGIYRYLGVRTAFWDVQFGQGRYRMKGVIAAIPEQESGEVERYQVIEGRLERDR
jgi:hypothetical protein